MLSVPRHAGSGGRGATPRGAHVATLEKKEVAAAETSCRATTIGVRGALLILVMHTKGSKKNNPQAHGYR